MDKTVKPIERQSLFAGIDIIRCFPNKPSNLQSLRNALAMALISKHGEIANVVKTGLGHVEAVIPRPQATGDEELDAASMSRYNRAMERQDIKIEKQVEQAPKLYADIMLQLSREAEDKLRDHGAFNEIDIAMDPVRLWNLIVLILAGGDRLDEIEMRTAPLDRYYAQRKEIKEPLPDFKRRFDDSIAAIISSGQEPPPPAHQAQNFLDRLCSAYNSMNLEYKNKLRPKPNTLAEAYQAAAERRVLSSQGLAVPVSEATVFVMTDSKPHAAHGSDSDASDEKSSDKKTKKKKKKNKGEKEPAMEPAKPVETKPAEPSKHMPTRDCALCTDRKRPEDRRHWTSDCPRLPQMKDLIKDGTIACALDSRYDPFGDEDDVVL